MKYHIYHDFVINTSANKVFKAISNADELMNWWPKKCSGSPEIHQVYNLYFEEAYNWYGKVSKIEINKHFEISMTEADEDWISTKFGFILTENENATQVQFYHENWPECNHHFKRSSYCWAILLRGLKDYVEQGKIIPFEERE